MWFFLSTYLDFQWAGSTLSTCQTRLIFPWFHHVHHPEFSQTRLTLHPSMTTIFVLVLDLFILFSFFFICYFIFLCFFSIFFLPSFFKFSGVLFDFWVWGRSRDAQRVELFLTHWPKFTSEKPIQSKPSPDQTIIRPNRSSKWTEVGWYIQTMSCFGWTIFCLNSTETERCPPLLLYLY
jgi:hypothetical protein